MANSSRCSCPSCESAEVMPLDSTSRYAQVDYYADADAAYVTTLFDPEAVARHW